jgi:hypothetical protein
MSIGPRKLVFVEWQDSYGCSSNWQEINPDGEPQMMLCHSVGWIVRKSKKCVVIVPHMSQNEDLAKQQGCGDMTIPTASIVRMIPLRFSGSAAVSVSSGDGGVLPVQGRKRPRS